MASIICRTVELALETRLRTKVSNWIDRSSAHHGALQQVEDYKKKFRNGQHRPVGPCSTFNCHGLTFGARRTWIDGSEQIERILIEDDYKKIEMREVAPGDIAIYRKDGLIEHSGIVVEKDNSPLALPKILSKWANLHEVVHFPLDSPYNDMEVTYYRVVK